ncbi:hypothetical protein [Kitasatospora sp. NPDC051914]|uniref:hypothetical protein n=1 Tax=Kitasatospora sp. NPDC051914 TaxID=3154945 RepID=UPI00341B9EEC
MARHTHDGDMPARLRAAMLRGAVDTFDYLQDVLRYCAPDRASHGWARMCMYRASDAMDTVGRMAGVIAAQLEHDGVERGTIRALLRVDRECVRTATPVRTGGMPYSPQELAVMPHLLQEQVRSSIARVMVRLQVVLRLSRSTGDELWPGRCLAPLAKSMDELGKLNGLIAAVHADTMNEQTLGRYQHLFQQQPRSGMPSADDRAYLAGLLGRPLGEGSSTWHLIGREEARRARGSLVRDLHEARVVALLDLLEAEFRDRRWEDENGRPLPPVQNAAVGCLHAREVATWPEDDEDEPLYWLSDENERVYAKAAAAALAARLSGTGPFGPISERGAR